MIIRGLEDKRCFPTIMGKIKKISNLYDHENIVFRSVFNGNLDMFLSHDLSEYKNVLSSMIGFKNGINQETFIKCAMKV